MEDALRIMIIGNGDLASGKSAGQAVLRGLDALFEANGFRVTNVGLSSMETREGKQCPQPTVGVRGHTVYGSPRLPRSLVDDYRGRLRFAHDDREHVMELLRECDALITFESEALSLLGDPPGIPHLHIQGDPSFLRALRGGEPVACLSLSGFRRLARVSALALGEFAFLWRWRRWMSLSVYGTSHARMWSRVLLKPVLDLRPYLVDTTEAASEGYNPIPTFVFGGSLGSTASLGGLRSLRDRVLPSLREEFGRNGFRLVLVGHLTQDWLEFIEKNNELIALGEVESFEATLCKADVFLNPIPYSVGVRTRVCAALSVGLPVVSSTAILDNMPELKWCQSIKLISDLNELGEATREILTANAASASEVSRSFFRKHYSIDAGGTLLAWVRAVAG